MQKYKKYLNNKSLFFLYGFISLLFKLSVIFTPIITGKVIDNAIAKDMNTLKIKALFNLIVVNS